MMAIASAPPSIGSVPAPASSSSTRAGVCSAPSIATMLAMWPEKVLRLFAIDCSSPMSAKTERNTGICDSSVDRDQQSRLGEQRQQARGLQRDGLAAGVRSGDDQDVHRRDQQDVHGHGLAIVGCRSAARGGLLGGVRFSVVVADMAPDRRNQQRVARRSQLEAAILRDLRLDAADQDREPRAGVQDVEPGGRIDGPFEIVGAAAERIGEGQQDAPDLFVLLLLQLHDVVVDLDRAQRLEIEAGAAARAAVNDAGDRPAVFGPDDQHVPAMPVGDDLLLQVFRRVLAAQVGLERAAQPRPLPPQALPDPPQLRRGIVHHLPRRIDLPADVGDLLIERGGPFDDGEEDRERGAAPAARLNRSC